MSFCETDIQRNTIAKKLCALLPQIDPKVMWVDYIPGSALKTMQSLIAIGMQNGNVKYVDVTKKSPFKLVNEVLNAMDDYRLDTQFLNNRQLQAVSEDIEQLAKDRARVADEVISILEGGFLSKTECLDIVREAQSLSIFPQFFPQTDKSAEVTPKMLENFLKTTKATFIDTQILSNLIKEKVREEEQNMEEENSEFYDFTKE